MQGVSVVAETTRSPSQFGANGVIDAGIRKDLGLDARTAALCLPPFVQRVGCDGDTQRVVGECESKPHQ
jgi:hypothetical protein